MSGLFGGKPAALPPPTITEIKTPIVSQETVDRNTQDLLRRRRGSAATVLTEGSTGATVGSVAGKTLLGQ